MAGFNPPLPNVGEKYTSIHEDDLGDHVTGIANASSPNIAYVFLSWDDGHYGERAIDEFWQEYMMVQTNDQAREGEAVANSAILARGRFHAFKGENGEPDDWEWFEEGTNCEHGCIDAVIVRADAIAAPQPAHPSEHAQPVAQPVAQPLTDEQINDVCVDVHLKRDYNTNLEKFIAIARAVERAHGIGGAL
jgi:hypothetical protein